MIRIKDVLINENDIRLITYYGKEMIVEFKEEGRHNLCFSDTGFDDIEFDYEYKQDNKYIEKLNNQIKELEEENNRLHKIIDKYEEERKSMY